MSVANNRFTKGHCYFLLGYYDRRFQFPYIQTFIYIGNNLDSGETENRWLFQEPDSYLKFGAAAPGDQSEDAGIVMFAEDALEGFFDASGLCQELTAIESDLAGNAE